MAPDKNKIAADCFRKGNEAMAKENWDYAIDMLDKAVRLVPDNVLFRQTKRGCTRKKYNDNGSGARMANVKLMGCRGRIKKSRLQKDWDRVDRAAEEGLELNPWDSGLNFDLGEACRQREYLGVAIEAYRTALQNDPKNSEYNRILGTLLRERGEYPEALKCFETILRVDPTNSEARSICGQIQAESVMDRGGYEKAEQTRDVKVPNAYEIDRQARKAKSKPDVGPGASVEEDLKRAIRKEPEAVNAYLKLADYYRNTKQLESAAETLKQAVDVSGNDSDVREQLEDVELDMMRNAAGLAREDARANSDDEKLVANAKALATELLQREIEVLSSRCDRYPNDMRFKMELGKRFMRADRPQQAVPLLQQASSDTRMKHHALVLLGEAFLKLKKADLARRQFEKALDGLSPQDHPDEFKAAHYFLGRIYEKKGIIDKADHHYTEILAIDYEYRDVLKRLESLQDDDQDDAL